MPTTTVEKTILKACRKIGLSNPSNSNKNDALDVLNDMLDNWSINDLLIYVNVKEQLTLSIGTGTYTIGSGGDLNTTRPESIVTIYLRDTTNSQDNPLIEMSETQYDDIIDKSVQTTPSRYFYSPEYPLGKLYLDYLPAAADTLLITSKKPFTNVALTDSFILPPGYNPALVYNLAVEIGNELGYMPDPVTVQKATRTLKDVERKNVPKMVMTTKGNLPNKGRRYNIYTGDFR